MVPKLDEYEYLMEILKDLGYEPATGSGLRRKGELFVYDFFRGNTIHTTELLHSPLKKGRHILVKEFSHIYLGVLNSYDLIISKLFRGRLLISKMPRALSGPGAPKLTWHNWKSISKRQRATMWLRRGCSKTGNILKRFLLGKNNNDRKIFIRTIGQAGICFSGGRQGF